MSNIIAVQKPPKTLLGFYLRVACKGSVVILGLAFLCRFIYGFDDILWPMYQRWIVGMLENAPAGVNLLKWCLPTILLILMCGLLTGVFSTLRFWFADILRPRVSRNISEYFTDYVHGHSLSFWSGRMAGEISSRINDISEGFDALFHDALGIFIKLFMLVINSVALFAVNKYVAFVFAFMFVFRVLFMWFLRKPIKRTSKDAADAKAKLSGKLVDSFSNFVTVKLFAGVAREHNFMAPLRADQITKKRKSSFYQRVSLELPMFVWDLCFAAMLVLLVYMYSRGTMNMADVVYAITVYTIVMWLIGAIIDTIPSMIERLASAQKAYSSLALPIDVVDKDGATDLVVRGGKIEFKNISFKYRNKRKYVLRDFSLTIKPGERVGLVGLSGAGKTTLVNLLMRFYDVDSGNILIDGADIRDVTQNSLRENISFIPQEATMFNRTIRENIAYGNPTATDAQIRNAAIRASAHKFIMTTEKKYDSYVGDRGIKLSGGQRQRIAIARAFLKRSPILVLDEATSALDSETEVAIQKSFETLSRNRTTIAIAHRLSTLRNMDRIVVMDKGRIVESGTHNALLKKRGLYARLWKMQSGGFLQEK